MSLFPLRELSRVRPVAAADYFLRNRFLAWFAVKVIGIIPIERHKVTTHEKLFKGITSAIDEGSIVILYPEGTRGMPERTEKFKNGIAHLCELREEVPVYPVFLHGLGKSLPKGEWILVPFFCDVYVGEMLTFPHNKKLFMEELDKKMKKLINEFNQSITEN
jgi:1-acyl-sn-glycerol-3-phosphate acyltransferase